MLRINSRGHKEVFYPGVHKTLEDLRNDQSLDNEKIRKDVQLPTKPIEFHTSKVVHVTGRRGFNGILDQDGFMVQTEIEKDWGFLWWGLSIEKDDIDAAEQRFLQYMFPNRTPEQASKQEPFLHKLTTSPVFQEGSRYGTFKFTFSLSELLDKYSRQFCRGKKLTLRVYETVVYKQEIMYVVVVHSPDIDQFDKYPELLDNGENVCALKGQDIVWRARAISNNCKFYLMGDYNALVLQQLQAEQYFVWEHVTLAFYLPADEILHFGEEKLLRSLTVCKQEEPNLCKDEKNISLDEAQTEVKKRKQRINFR